MFKRPTHARALAPKDAPMRIHRSVAGVGGEVPNRRTETDDRIMVDGGRSGPQGQELKGLRTGRLGLLSYQFFKAIFIMFVCDVWHGVPQTVVAGRRPRESALSLSPFCGL